MAIDTETPGQQLALLHSLRLRMAVVEMVFHDDAGHPLTERLQYLAPDRFEGVSARPGYDRAEPRAVLHRYGYDRAIISALADLGGLFVLHRDPRGDRVDFTDLGNVDLSFYDATGNLFCYTVTHEGLVFLAE
ncbi:hypothetical protein IPV09_07860 [Tessaracoccus sp. SD287]|uniref:hypothetical protein n=1 Tax=Tessaracoccus sp. SD287 TaxID=2782008 RepID=UPI001A965C9C|nr:hypothetical protein [Tessaracoccus sp. SD287]MBO1031251.1 hypothetical protein [Tessaracoccus sp. SD287]